VEDFYLLGCFEATPLLAPLITVVWLEPEPFPQVFPCPYISPNIPPSSLAPSRLAAHALLDPPPTAPVYSLGYGIKSRHFLLADTTNTKCFSLHPAERRKGRQRSTQQITQRLPTGPCTHPGHLACRSRENPWCHLRRHAGPPRTPFRLNSLYRARRFFPLSVPVDPLLKSFYQPTSKCVNGDPHETAPPPFAP